MLHKESKSDRNKRFARIWSLSRSDAGKTQEFMANGLGVSKKTIQNWEKGASAPDLYEGSEWFRVLGTNPMPYYLAFLYPWLFDGIKPEDDDQEIEQALLFLVKNMTSVEKREMLYLMAGRHGSPWYSAADVHRPLPLLPALPGHRRPYYFGELRDGHGLRLPGVPG